MQDVEIPYRLDWTDYDRVAAVVRMTAYIASELCTLYLRRTNITLHVRVDNEEYSFRGTNTSWSGGKRSNFLRDFLFHINEAFLNRTLSGIVFWSLLCLFPPPPAGGGEQLLVSFCTGTAPPDTMSNSFVEEDGGPTASSVKEDRPNSFVEEDGGRRPSRNGDSTADDVDAPQSSENKSGPKRKGGPRLLPTEEEELANPKMNILEDLDDDEEEVDGEDIFLELGGGRAVPIPVLKFLS